MKHNICTRRKIIAPILGVLFCLLSGTNVLALNIALDHPVRCGKLQCFPDTTNKNEFYYLPSDPHVSFRENGKPEFSFLRYVKNKADSGSEMGGITEAEGGGIVHFLVDYTVSDKLLSEANKALKKDNPDAVLRGPIMFESGNFALVSSFNTDNGKSTELTRQVIGVGRAPLIEGLKAAVSMHLTKLGTQILWRSFQMATPDVSLVFEMTFSGLTDPAEATITANWTKLQKQADITLGAKVSYMNIGGGFDYGNFWEKAKESGAISIDYRGDPTKLQSIIDRAYARLHDIMFEPIPVDQPGADKDGDPLQAMMDAMNAARQDNSLGGNYSAPWEVKINGGYRRRNIQRTGEFKLDFRERSRSTITTAMAGNIGPLYSRFGTDPTIFKTVNLSDPSYRVREISVALDARNSEEFSKYINHVTLSISKSHGSGTSTPGEITINRSNFSEGLPRSLTYHWDNEPGVDEWMFYKYKVDWSFIGGARYSMDWTRTDQAAISLTPPYQFRKVEFMANPDILEKENVRLVTIRVRHDFFGRQVKETINLLPSRQQNSVEREFAVPPDQKELEYEITWTLKDKRKISSGTLKSDETIIFCDELPSP
ncbi:conserved hypothetical protein [Candidatus Nitrotoga sp. BS]|uniref:hypothetical protein n=1 Tax=Candidatus Nitrotoga sp. BS TaxID=2890408 RepID=UPI001EF3BE8B|nr:hypothetical protein [Candidatus Nitrotoga sp. BS]CAH1211298.1 conserved hypothetical protein [Candidatus Nitrotoga sp. BS]